MSEKSVEEQLKDLQIQYNNHCAALGDAIYKHELGKRALLDKLVEINQAASELTKSQDKPKLEEVKND